MVFFSSRISPRTSTVIFLDRSPLATAVVTSQGRLIRIGVLEIPALPPSAHSPSLAGGAPIAEFVSLEPGETVVSLAAPDGSPGGLAVGTADGVVKRVAPDYPASATEFEVISLKEGDRVVGAVQLAGDDADLVFITSDAQLLRFQATAVRPQGRAAGGMAGIRLSAGAGFVTPLLGEMRTMPGLPSHPAGESIDIEAGGWIYRDENVPMQQQVYGLKTGIFGGSGNLVFNRFTGPGRVGIQSAYVHLPTEN